MKKLFYIVIFLLRFFVTKAQINLTDKDKHFLAGNCITAATGYSMYWLTDRPVLGAFCGFLTGCAAGYAKELYDKKFNPHDLADTVWGSANGFVNLTVEINIERKKGKIPYLYREKYNINATKLP